jgi:hypothetical protein
MNRLSHVFTHGCEISVTSVTEMAITVVEMDVDLVTVHMADANDYSDIPFHVCHLYF